MMELKDSFFKVLSTHKMACHFPLCLSDFVAKVFLRSKTRAFLFFNSFKQK
jgi:hypothetical protein